MSSKTAEKGKVTSKESPTSSEARVGAARPQQSSPLAFFAIFLPFCALLARWSIGLHYGLPEPVHDLRHPHTGLPQFSEAKALDYVRHYSEDIGYRIVGTPEMTRTVAYTLDVLEGLKKEAASSSSAANVEIEISHQKGAGHHLFEFMGKKVWKKYLGLDNVVVRLSNGSAASKENAILVNAHLDSTLPSPGAADDAAGVGIMLEALRVLSQTPDVKLSNSIIFLFNGAEESLQDASHLFITQHEWRSTVRAVVNLEAAGTAGAEMLFQATSTEMLKAYSHVPRPNGAVIATEVFGTGLILSDTDFRQFEQYGGLTGLDMALVKDSYKYHTRLDRAQYIERGALQHFGDNMLAILVHLAGTTTASELRNVTKARETVYFAMLGGRIFVCIQANYVLAGYAVLWLASVALIWTRMQKGRGAGYAVALVSIPGSLVSALVTANLTAVTMAYVLDEPLSYFRREWWSVLLYGVPTLLGIVLCQLATARIVHSRKLLPAEEGALEHSLLYAALLYNSTFALAGHSLGMLSSYCWGIAAAALFVTLVVNDFVLLGSGQGPNPARARVSILAYLLAQTPSIVAGAEGLMSFLDVVVPLTGRMGVEAPGDIITASLVSGVGFLVVPTLPALCHRFGSAFLARVALVLTLAVGVIVSIFASSSRPTFDAMHPKRVLCLYMENITSHDLSLHMANIDGTGTVFNDLVHASTAQLGLLEKPALADIGDSIPDWDIIYPVSQFLHSYKIPLPALAPDYVSPFKDSFKVEALESRLNAVTQTRYVRLALRHPGIIWTVMAFNGDVVQWDLPEPAERGDIRHHVKEVSGAGIDTWELSMTLKLSNEQFAAAQRNAQRRKGQRPVGGPEDQEDRKVGGVRIDFSGLDVNRMWHHRENQNRTGMEFLERLDRAMPDWTDPMLLTAVAAVEYV